MMESLVAAVRPQSYKFVVYSTLIQQAHEAPGDTAEAPIRGMHAASGALWNSEKDGMFSFKYGVDDGPGEKRGFDVVINVVWIAC